jgi:lysozyme family protein
MNNFYGICNWVLRIEDSTLSGHVANLMDGQGRTRFGIAEFAHPELPTDFYVCHPSEALQIAVGIYRATYWNRFSGDQISDDQVASCLLSFSINDGTQREIMMLQQVLGFTQTDGIMGPITLSATNKMDPATLAPALRIAQANFYRMLVTKQPTDARFIDGWLRRASLVYPNL